jgi:acetolactate synthase-1/3 small subunit
LEKLIRQHNAKVLEIEEEYIIVEKTGHAEETEALLEALKEIGIFEFVRSGRVAIPRPMERLSKYLQQLELEAEETL